MKKTKILPNVRSFFKKTSKQTDIVGYVDKIESGSIHGWAIHKLGVVLDLECDIDGKIYQGETQWLSRDDVAAQYDLENSYCGFRMSFEYQVAQQIEDALALNKPIRILANNTLLENIAQKDNSSAKSLKPEMERIRNNSAVLSAEIEMWGHFTLQGWVEAKNENETPKCQLFCNRQFLENISLRKEASTSTQDTVRYRFEAELAGYIWEADENEALCQLEISLGNDSITLTPPELNRTKAMAWIDDILQMQDGKEKQYRLLLALEHIRYGNFLSDLEPSDAAFVLKFVKQMQLDEFFENNEIDRSAEIIDAPSESVAVLLLWKALKALNDRVSRDNTAVFDQVKLIIEELRLKGRARDGFLHSTIPLLCIKGEFLRLRELLNFTELQEELDKSYIPWEMTVAVPAMIADKKIERATNLVYRIVDYVNKPDEWLNLECIYFAIQLLQQMEVAVEVDVEEGQKFRYAVISLIDAYQGEWFSRVQDQNLIGVMLLLLTDIDGYTDYHRRDILAAAIRNYGLNPSFWQQAKKLNLSVLDKELAYACKYFEQIQEGFSKDRDSLVTWIENIAEPLAYFQSKGNFEAVMFLREILANFLPSLNESLTSKGKDLLRDLLANDNSEALRIAAFPLPMDNQLLHHFPETSPEILKETLRHLSKPSKSVTWYLQNKASNSLKELFDADDKILEVTFTKLEPTFIKLADRLGGFLSFDLLAGTYALISKSAYGSSPLLVRMLTNIQWMLQAAIDETQAEWLLPVPIQSGLICLNRVVNKGDILLRGFLVEYRNAIRQKFGTRMDVLFDFPEELKLELDVTGWPKDTLVVIYSCKKYLDTRVQAIRETWVQDLNARNIPYVVLVGDGDDTLQDDVLALNVSDRYEDLPQKTLKLFDWVYHHTNAQYVLKIDDDCYLNVEQFFDSLSYRKHFYYGRVIRRSVGGMDRTWHQSKSQTEHCQKRIDKSPEPSLYADGGGGYTLSRLAMFKLLEAEKTIEGEKLISCSFMEDKLVGDLLALASIEPSDEDYESYQRRRTFGEAMPVGMWENTFFPTQATPTKMTHLDNALDFESTHKKVHSKELWPKKIWPTCFPPHIHGSNTNQLELLTASESVASLLEHELCVITVVRNEMTMLPHFLQHYRDLGVQCFMMVDNCSDDGTREYLYQQTDVILYSTDTEYKSSHYGVAWQQAILGNHCLGKWVLLVDADELLVFENCETRTLEEFVADIDEEGCNAAMTLMIDMYPANDLDDANFLESKPFESAAWFDKEPLIDWYLGSGKYGNGKTYLSALRHRFSNETAPNSFTSQKYALIRYYPWIRYSEGLHDASNINVSENITYLAHFKYHAGFKEKIKTEIRRGQHFGNAAEYHRYAEMLSELKGGFRDEKNSSKYTSSKDFYDMEKVDR